METITLNFKASGQNLTADAHPQRYASNTVNYIQAVFDLDENWQSFDSVRAVWHNDFACISTVLDGNGACTVPHEVLTNLDEVIVNLVGSDVDGEELVDRMTTYPLRVVIIDAHARICGTETVEVTPSQFEQYIAIVEQIVGTVKDIDHTELTDDYCLIIYYSDGTNSGKLGPIRGATGATGNGIVSAVLNADYTLTLTYDNGDSDTVGPIRGAQGETGNGIESVYLTETHGAVKTYTILFTDGTTTTFDVTDGEVTRAELESVLPTDTASGAIASFPDGSDLFYYLSCVVEINPVQAGSGTPSPDNVRPITGWTGCEVVVSPTEDAQDGTTYPVSWQDEAGTVYGGTVDVVTGVLTVTHAFVDMGDLGWSYGTSGFYATFSGLKYVGNTETVNALSSGYTAVSRTYYNTNPDVDALFRSDNANPILYFRNKSYTDADAFKTAMEGVQVVYPLATPQTYQLTSTQIHALLGQNNVWADCGDVEVQYKADVQRWVEKMLNA